MTGAPDTAESGPVLLHTAQSPPHSSIAGVVIAENEAHVLDRCLHALWFCDELIVVDGGSTDGSDAIAKARGARLIRHSSSDHGIHYNKNLGCVAATADWVLSIDADEIVSPELATEIRRTLQAPAYPCYQVARRTWFLGRWIRHCGWWPGHVVRLWRRGHTAWPLEVHRVPDPMGPCGTLAEPLDHYSYLDIADWGRKVIHFSGCEAVEAKRRGETVRGAKLVYQLTLAPVIVFLKKVVAQSAWRDGVAGLVIAGSAAFATWLRAVRHWEITVLKREPNLGGRAGRRVDRDEERVAADQKTTEMETP